MNKIEYRHKGAGKLFPHAFTVVSNPGDNPMLAMALLREIRTWCEEQFGPSSEVPGLKEYRWACDIWTVRFCRDDDAAAFKLRWY